MKKILWLAAVALLFTVAGVSSAQDYPTRPIRLIVPSGPGGGLDLIGRSIVARIGDGLGKPVVVENKPGGGGDIATDLVAKAKPDGYTLLMASATYVVRAGMFKVPYDPIGDFAPVMQISAAPYAIVVNASLPVKSIPELVAYAKANPGKINFGSQGNGSLVHLVGELIKANCGIDMVHVPYKGAGAAFTDLLANQIQLGILTLPSALPYTKSDKLRALAVTSRERAQAIPELPTMIEGGVKDFTVTQWHAVLAPKGTPRPIVERLNQEIRKVLQQPEVAKYLANEGAEIVGSSPEQFEAHIKAEYEKWGKLIKQIGLRKE
jgi:tripartite-type tricarboxylate transporter receptor subunit TctC